MYYPSRHLYCLTYICFCLSFGWLDSSSNQSLTLPPFLVAVKRASIRAVQTLMNIRITAEFPRLWQFAIPDFPRISGENSKCNSHTRQKQVCEVSGMDRISYPGNPNPILNQTESRQAPRNRNLTSSRYPSLGIPIRIARQQPFMPVCSRIRKYWAAFPSARCIFTHPRAPINTSMDDEEFFRNDDYSLISRIAGAIRDVDDSQQLSVNCRRGMTLRGGSLLTGLGLRRSRKHIALS